MIQINESLAQNASIWKERGDGLPLSFVPFVCPDRWQWSNLAMAVVAFIAVGPFDSICPYLRMIYDPSTSNS